MAWAGLGTGAQAGVGIQPGKGNQPSSLVGQVQGHWELVIALGLTLPGMDRLMAPAVPERWAEQQRVGGKSKGFPQERVGESWHTNRTHVGPCSLLTFRLAHVVCLHEVLGAAADVGALGVVAELGAGPKAQALVDVWAAGDGIRPGGCPHRPQLCPKDTIPAAPAPPQL